MKFNGRSIEEVKQDVENVKALDDMLMGYGLGQLSHDFERLIAEINAACEKEGKKTKTGKQITRKDRELARQSSAKKMSACCSFQAGYKEERRIGGTASIPSLCGA